MEKKNNEIENKKRRRKITNMKRRKHYLRFEPGTFFWLVSARAVFLKKVDFLYFTMYQ